MVTISVFGRVQPAGRVVDVIASRDDHRMEIDGRVAEHLEHGRADAGGIDHQGRTGGFGSQRVLDRGDDGLIRRAEREAVEVAQAEIPAGEAAEADRVPSGGMLAGKSLSRTLRTGEHWPLAGPVAKAKASQGCAISLALFESLTLELERPAILRDSPDHIVRRAGGNLGFDLHRDRHLGV